MRWIETASGSVLLTACDSNARPRVACRRTAALFWLSSSCARYADSRKICPSTPQEGKKVFAKLLSPDRVGKTKSSSLMLDAWRDK